MSKKRILLAFGVPVLALWGVVALIDGIAKASVEMTIALTATALIAAWVWYIIKDDYE